VARMIGGGVSEFVGLKMWVCSGEVVGVSDGWVCEVCCWRRQC